MRITTINHFLVSTPFCGSLNREYGLLPERLDYQVKLLQPLHISLCSMFMLTGFVLNGQKMQMIFISEARFVSS